MQVLLISPTSADLPNWTADQKVVANDGILEDEFGCSVSLNGNRLAVGSRYSDVAGPRCPPTLPMQVPPIYLQ